MGEPSLFDPDAPRSFRATRPASLSLEALAEVSVPAQGEWTATVSRGASAVERFEEMLAHRRIEVRERLRIEVNYLLACGYGAVTDGERVWTEERVPAGMVYFVRPPIAAAS